MLEGSGHPYDRNCFCDDCTDIRDRLDDAAIMEEMEAEAIGDYEDLGGNEC